MIYDMIYDMQHDMKYDIIYVMLYDLIYDMLWYYLYHRPLDKERMVPSKEPYCNSRMQWGRTVLAHKFDSFDAAIGVIDLVGHWRRLLGEGRFGVHGKVGEAPQRGVDGQNDVVGPEGGVPEELAAGAVRALSEVHNVLGHLTSAPKKWTPLHIGF